MAHSSAVRTALAFVGRLSTSLLLTAAAVPGTALVSLLGLAAFDATAVTNNPAGITGRTNKNGGTGCGGCHAQDAGIAVTITGPTAAPFALAAGQSGTFTITATKGGLANGYYMGIAVAATDSTSLSNFSGEPTAIASGEVIHSASAGALKTSSGGSANYKFTFTMPGGATAGSSKTIYGLAAIGIPRAPWNHASNVTVYVPPAAPSSVSASNVTAASVDLSWSGGGTNYLVVYKTGASAPTSTTDGTAVDVGTSTSTTVSGLAQTVQYSFAVYSKISGVAVYSTSAATTTATTLTPVIAPRYVNAATGNNTGDCTSAGAPCKTITYAMAQATTGSPGDSVNVAPGTYNVALGESFPIAMKSGVQLQSTGTAANTIVDATGANARVFDASGGNGSTVIQGFTITGGLHVPALGGNAQGGAMLIDNLAEIRVRRNIFIDNEARGYAGEAPSYPSGGVAYGGAIVSSNASPTIENNVFVSNTVQGGNGLSKFDGSAGGDAGQGHGGALFVGGGAAVIINNTFYANEARGGAGGSSNASSGGSGGLAFNGAVESSNASVVNNIFVNNSASGGSGGGGSPAGSTGNSFNGALNDNGGPSTTNNLFFGNTAASNGDTQGTNAILLDPHFHAAPTNLRIGLTSPAKAAGTATGAPVTDLDGTTRPLPPSIGAFEASDPTVTYNLVLEGWQQVSPYVVTTATGSGTATYNTVTRALTLNLPYSGLSGTETGAHIHGPAARGANAGVLYGLAAASPKADTVTLTVAQETQLFAGELYVNIHTSNYPNGEIRAQIDNVGATVTRALTVVKAGAGTGTVTGTAEPGTVINCGGDCTETVPNGKVVTLSAAPSAGSTFSGWSGGGCTGTGTCLVTMSAAASVTATFTLNPMAPAVGLSTTSITFGGQSMNTTSPPSVVTLTNTGNATLTVSGVSIDNAQFTQTNNCTSVAAAATCTINVSFSPANVAGALNSTAAVTGTLSITSDATGSPHAVGLSGTAEKSLVTHYYRGILNRAPDGPGKAFWESEAARLAALGVNVSEVWYVMAGYFFNSAEYIAANKTNEQFVADLYNTFFNRPPDAGGQGYWVSQIVGGLPREVVLFSFMFSNEFRTFSEAIFGNTAARPEVDMVVDFFRGLLNRLPDTASFNYWLGQLRTAQCAGAGPVYTAVDQISAAFMFNPEYDNRARSNTQFVTDMYYSFLRRGGDVGGVNYWINELNTSARYRNDVRYFGFLNSAEFGARVQAVIAAGCAQ